MPFRLSARNLFLTYPQSGEETPDGLKEFLLCELDVKALAICRETHEDGGFHLHALVKLNRKCNIINEHKLDFNGLHGNYTVARNVGDCYEYVNKEPETYIEWGEFDNDDFIKREIIQCKSELEVMNVLDRVKKHHQLTFWKRWWYLNRLSNSTEAPIRDMDEFNVPIQVSQWMDDHEMKSLILVGPSGGGKTSLARSVGTTIGNIFWCPERQSLTAYAGEETIIFDDTDFGSVSRTTLLNFLDMEQSRSFRVLYGSVYVPSGIRRIFTTNSLEFLLGENQFRPEIQRRIKVVECGDVKRGAGVQRAEELPPRVCELLGRR